MEWQVVEKRKKREVKWDEMKKMKMKMRGKKGKMQIWRKKK
jgi:hypothetical protein